MQSRVMLGLTLATLAALPAAAQTAPADVVFNEGAIETSLTGTPGDAAEGAKVMASRAMGNCVACHVVTAMPEASFQGNVGPALDGAASRWSEAQLRGIVANAKMTFDGTVMPAFYKTEGYIRPGDAYTGKAPTGPLPPILDGTQIENVVAYLMTLKD
jgi:L-cysteine S-thiosulfotransferase